MMRIKKGSPLPPEVAMCIEESILASLGFEDPFRYKIIETKKSVVPFSTIKMLCDGDTPTSYKVRIADKKRKEPFPTFRNITTISSQIYLGEYDPKEIAKFDTLREYEDYQTVIKSEQRELEQQELAKKEIDINFIQKIQQKLDPIVARNINLPDTFQHFKDVSGFKKIMEEIISNFYISSNGKQSVSGRVFELKCALQLVNQENETIAAFSTNYRSLSDAFEYDLLTASGTLIECKYKEEHLKLGRIKKQAQCAHYHGKTFKVYIGEKLSDETKNWFKKHAISFEDDLMNK